MTRHGGPIHPDDHQPGDTRRPTPITLTQARSAAAAARRISDDIAAIARSLEDVYYEASDKQQTGEKIRQTKSGWYLDEIGRFNAKLWLDVVCDPRTGLFDLEKRVAGYRNGMDELMSAGQIDNTLKGTLLSDVDPETGTPVEGSAQRNLRELHKAADRRHDRGEYTPARKGPQPSVTYRQNRP